jgi:hypothetical protein
MLAATVVYSGQNDLSILCLMSWNAFKPIRKFHLLYADTPKGSYFANPVFDVPTTDDELVTRYNVPNPKLSFCAVYLSDN